MTYRALVLKELATLLGVLAHPARLRIVEELRSGEKDVTALGELLGVASSTTSQHLALLRAHAVVHERREGRRVFYRLDDERLAGWLVDGLRFIEPSGETTLKHAVARARNQWTSKPSRIAPRSHTDSSSSTMRPSSRSSARRSS